MQGWEKGSSNQQTETVTTDSSCSKLGVPMTCFTTQLQNLVGTFSCNFPGLVPPSQLQMVQGFLRGLDVAMSMAGVPGFTMCFGDAPESWYATYSQTPIYQSLTTLNSLPLLNTSSSLWSGVGFQITNFPCLPTPLPSFTWSFAMHDLCSGPNFAFAVSPKVFSCFVGAAGVVAPEAAPEAEGAAEFLRLFSPSNFVFGVSVQKLLGAQLQIWTGGSAPQTQPFQAHIASAQSYSANLGDLINVPGICPSCISLSGTVELLVSIDLDTSVITNLINGLMSSQGASYNPIPDVTNAFVDCFGKALSNVANKNYGQAALSLVQNSCASMSAAMTLSGFLNLDFATMLHGLLPKISYQIAEGTLLFKTSSASSSTGYGSLAAGLYFYFGAQFDVAGAITSFFNSLLSDFGGVLSRMGLGSISIPSPSNGAAGGAMGAYVTTQGLGFFLEILIPVIGPGWLECTTNWSSSPISVTCNSNLGNILTLLWDFAVQTLTILIQLAGEVCAAVWGQLQQLGGTLVHLGESTFQGNNGNTVYHTDFGHAVEASHSQANYSQSCRNTINAAKQYR